MGKFGAEFRRLYWLQRFLDTLPDPPPKTAKFEDLTDEQKVARYCHRSFYILTGEKFDKKKFDDMMKPPQI
jgi:hypothetical protein